MTTSEISYTHKWKENLYQQTCRNLASEQPRAIYFPTIITDIVSILNLLLFVTQPAVCFLLIYTLKRLEFNCISCAFPTTLPYLDRLNSIHCSTAIFIIAISTFYILFDQPAYVLLGFAIQTKTGSLFYADPGMRSTQSAYFTTLLNVVYKRLRDSSVITTVKQCNIVFVNGDSTSIFPNWKQRRRITYHTSVMYQWFVDRELKSYNGSELTRVYLHRVQQSFDYTFPRNEGTSSHNSKLTRDVDFDQIWKAKRGYETAHDMQCSEFVRKANDIKYSRRAKSIIGYLSFKYQLPR